MNLLTETREAIADAGRMTDEVALVGSADGTYGCTWEAFVTIADVAYDNGFGAPEVATDLRVWFLDGSYLKRREYDGSEWWEYVTTTPVPTPSKPLTRVLGALWPNVDDLNGEDSENYHR